VSVSEKAGKAGIKYVEYLVDTWMPKPLWDSWSEEGRIRAAEVLGVGVGSVLSTTNHLESFNGVLKRKHIGQLQRSGKRLRFDVLIFRLVLYVLPNIYAQFRLLRSFKSWKKDRFSSAAGVEGISCQIRPKTVKKEPPHPVVAWYSPDPLRDGPAVDFVRMQRIIFVRSAKPFEIWATCATTSADTRNCDYPRYWLTSHPSGHATCTCADWLGHGGACKHLRALRHLIASSIAAGSLQHPFHFPENISQALHVLEQNKHWYGSYYQHSLTEPLAHSFASPTPPPSFSRPPGHTPLPPPTMPDISLVPTIEQEAEIEAELVTLGATDSGPNWGDASDQTTYEINHGAINHQHRQRLDNLISTSLPGLYGISNILQDYSPSETNLLVTEFSQIISTLSMQMDNPTIVPDLKSTSTSSQNDTN